MGHVPLLDELVIVAVLAVAVTVILSRLKLPTVAGLIAAGALLGPFGLGLATSVNSIEALADIGVVLLLFTIGLEFSFARLRDVLRHSAVGGLVQIGLTAAAATLIAVAWGQPLGPGLFYGFVFALSSTAIVLRTLTERREVAAPHGRFIVGTLIFQDLCVVPMVMMIPLLASLGGASEAGPGSAALDIGLTTLKAVGVILALVAIARFLVPHYLRLVEASKSREVFLLAVISLCIGTAWLTSLAGLSLALGAFLAGMLVADTEYGRRAMGDVLPLRDVFVSIFFVSLGMLFDARSVLAHPLLVAALLAGFVLGKGALAAVAALAMRFPSRGAWLAGVGLAQFSEFGFVLVRLAESSGLIKPDAATPLLNAGILSMFLTPLLLRVAPHVKAGEYLLAPLARLFGARQVDEESLRPLALRDHVVIVGFGLAGRFASRTLTACGVPFVVLDLDGENVRRGKALGLPVFYGDATSVEALGHVHVDRAKLVVLLMNDPQAAERVVDTVHRVAPNASVLMRTRYLAERDTLMALGARDVVAEEVEGAVEVISRLLRQIDTPRNVIDARIHEVRAETQTTERRQTVPRNRMGDVSGLADMKIESALVHPESGLVGRSPVELRLRSVTGALIVGVRRAGALLEHSPPTTPFEAGDLVYFVGTPDAVSRALALFAPPSHAGAPLCAASEDA